MTRKFFDSCSDSETCNKCNVRGYATHWSSCSSIVHHTTHDLEFSKKMDVRLSHVAFDTLEVSKEEKGRMGARITGLDLFHLSLSSFPMLALSLPSPAWSFLQQLQPSLVDAGLSSLSLIWSGKSYVSTVS